MPLNVSPEYAAAEMRYHKARTIEDKIAALQEMIRLAPDHKGAEKFRKELTRKMKALQRELKKAEEQRRKAARGRTFAVKKEGIGQIALVGMPNAGKSTLLRALTGADVTVASYPFTTFKPEPAMMEYRKAQIQLVEIPALVEGSSSGKANGTEWLSIIRNADAIALILSYNNPVYEYTTLVDELTRAAIILNQQPPKIEIKKGQFKGINISNKHYLRIPEKQVKEELRSRGIFNASLVLNEPTDVTRLTMALDKRYVFKPALAVVMACQQLPNDAVMDKLQQRIPTYLFDCSAGAKHVLSKALFELLGKILIYTKKPGHDFDELPMAVPVNCTVEEAAGYIHKDFQKKLKYARVWGSTRFPGQRVARDYVLKDGDMVEFFI
jgi:hypothetical protein